MNKTNLYETLKTKKEIRLYIKPNKDKTQIKNYNKYRKRYVMLVNKPASNDEANKEIIKHLNQELNATYKIIRGLKSKRKTVRINDQESEPNY